MNRELFIETITKFIITVCRLCSLVKQTSIPNFSEKYSQTSEKSIDKHLSCDI